MSDIQQPSSSRKHSPTNTSGSELATDPPMLNLEEAEEDRKHMQKIVAALRYYQ